MNRSRARRFLISAMAAAGGLVIVLAALRLAVLDGWLRTVRIDGPSMAPALCGTHLDVICSDCGISFRSDGEQLPESGRLVCPNCGLRELKAGDFPLRPGDTVLVDRWPLLWRAPRRWEVVAYNDPHSPGAAVKRIAGLPGETIAIERGDLFAGGRIIRKTLAEFWPSAVLLHDDAFRPESLAGGESPSFLRWRPGSQESGWKVADGEYRFGPKAPAAAACDWLEYIHWRCDASLTTRDEPSAILDNDPYNQAVPRRLNPVHDLVLSCQAELSPGGELVIAIWARGGWFQVRLDSGSQTVRASADGRELAAARIPRAAAGRPFELAVGQFDAQLVAAIDGKDVLVHPLELDSGSDAAAPPSARVRLAATAEAAVSRLRVWRDIYLLEPRGTDRAWSADRPLAAGEYFVLGDNPPVSIDSRHWDQAGIARGRLRGIVIGPRRMAP